MEILHKASAIRQAIRESLPTIDPEQDTFQAIRSTYVPPSHAKALDPDNTVVEGIRGAGKSFWTSALSSPEHRAFIVSFTSSFSMPWTA